ncbi:PucR family transcriptional regulator [Nakamurella antarctica]|uniref:PucR family transcriptional regulator n=2 Tax=Nakamurella antarctica TaxID=1902245 RepID=A0A3G8ZQT3_9ACTN|nr:PucR family transcriptional regulator [Nakamurella antarctica]
MATRAVALMDEQLPWFRSLPADQRSWVTLVAQAGIAGYVPWARTSDTDLRLTDTVFGTAPRDLSRAVSLRRTVELVRIAIDVAEVHVPALGATENEKAALSDSLLRYSREIAFAAAAVYATAAETRGAWDARVEAAVVDGIIRGEDEETLSSRAAALGWDATAAATVVLGSAGSNRTEAVARVSEWAKSLKIPAMAGVQGSRLIIVLGGPLPDLAELLTGGAGLFAGGPIVLGPTGAGLSGAVSSAVEALAGLRASPAWLDAPRPVASTDLLAERAIAGDPTAAARLRTAIYEPLAASTSPLTQTLQAYLDHGGALEPAARALFVHPNTMRYRLHRIAETTGRDPWNSRDALALQVALILGRLQG